MNILEKANDIVHGERQQDYGHPADNHRATARFWNVYWEEKLEKHGPGYQLTPQDVCFLMILQKISRTLHGDITTDTLVDIAGYAANIEMIEERQEQNEAPVVGEDIFEDPLKSRFDPNILKCTCGQELRIEDNSFMTCTCGILHWRYNGTIISIPPITFKDKRVARVYRGKQLKMEKVDDLDKN